MPPLLPEDPLPEDPLPEELPAPEDEDDDEPLCVLPVLEPHPSHTPAPSMGTEASARARPTTANGRIRCLVPAARPGRQFTGHRRG